MKQEIVKIGLKRGKLFCTPEVACEWFFLWSIFFFNFSCLQSQNIVKKIIQEDSLKPDFSKKLNDITDSTIKDSLLQSKQVSFSPSSYFSEFSIVKKNKNGEQISIYEGKAKLIYENMKIEAHRIEINFETNILIATPKIDTLENGKIKYIGEPVFTQAGTNPMYGARIIYDFKKKRGKIFEGKTQVATAKYHGEEIKKIGKKTLLIRNGRFTTCLADSPSYWIHAGKIRMIQNDRIFTGPIYMTIQDIPFPIPLPFGIFSMKKGRHSGVIIPSFFSGTTRGRGLHNIGYYWAASDYFEAEFLADYFEKTGFVYRINTKFRDRYTYTGNFSGHFEPQDQITGEVKNRYGFNFTYNHTIDPSLTINGSGRFESSQTNRKNYRDFQNQTNQVLSSRLSISKRWLRSSLVSSFNYSKNLLTKQEFYTAPSLSFQVNIFPLFGEAKDPLNKRWYEKINVNYNSQAKNIWKKEGLGVYRGVNNSGSLGAKHSIILSAPYKIFKYIRLNPHLSYEEIWTNEIPELDRSSTKDTLIIRKINKFGALRTFSAGVTLNTNLYGFFEPNIGSLKILRHKISPSISFSYRPNFSNSVWGNTETISQGKYNPSLIRIRKDGTKYIDKFYYSIYGKTPNSEQFTAFLNLANTLSGKFINEKKESKIDLIDFHTSTSINFLKDSLRWGDLGSSFSFPFIKTFSFSGNMRHSLYELDKNGNRRNKFVKYGIPILKNISFSVSYQLNHKNSSGKTKITDSLETEIRLKTRVEKFKTQDIPWNINLSSTYYYERFIQGEKTRWTMSISAQLKLTQKWSVSYNTSVDMNNYNFQYQSLSITRDLECWNFSFTYSPNPYNSYFLLNLSIKDNMLKDIKYNRRSRNLPIF